MSPPTPQLPTPDARGYIKAPDPSQSTALLTSAEVVHGAEEETRRTAGSKASRTETRIQRGSVWSRDETQETWDLRRLSTLRTTSCVFRSHGAGAQSRWSRGWHDTRAHFKADTAAFCRILSGTDVSHPSKVASVSVSLWSVLNS